MKKSRGREEKGRACLVGRNDSKRGVDIIGMRERHVFFVKIVKLEGCIGLYFKIFFSHEFVFMNLINFF